jgi:electron transport complex protein RnfG
MGKIFKLTICLTVIAAFCAAVLAYVNASTKDAIKAIRAKQTLDAAKAVMPSDVEKVERAQGADGVFVGKNADGKTSGYAVRGVDHTGYSGDVVLMVGFTPEFKVVTYKKLEANETPGLGSNLTSEGFVKQFSGKDATIPLKVKKDGGDIEAITSATITSRAVCGAINDAKIKLENILK